MAVRGAGERFGALGLKISWSPRVHLSDKEQGKALLLPPPTPPTPSLGHVQNGLLGWQLQMLRAQRVSCLHRGLSVFK